MWIVSHKILWHHSHLLNLTLIDLTQVSTANCIFNNIQLFYLGTSQLGIHFQENKQLLCHIVWPTSCDQTLRFISYVITYVPSNYCSIVRDQQLLRAQLSCEVSSIYTRNFLFSGCTSFTSKSQIDSSTLLQVLWTWYGQLTCYPIAS